MEQIGPEQREAGSVVDTKTVRAEFDLKTDLAEI